MATKIQIKRDTSANWKAANPVLSAGEPGMETDTGIVKYGNGTTAWNDLSVPASTENNFAMKAWSGNDWKFISSSGGKSFTFKTAGHVRTNVRVNNSQTWDTSTGFVVNVSEHPTIIDSVKTAYDAESSPYIFINGNWSGFVDHYTLVGDVMTVYITLGPYTLNVNDTIQFAGWNRGTQAVFNTYYSSTGPVTMTDRAYDGLYWQPTTDASNTNVVTVDFTGEFPEVLAALESGSGKNYIVFDEYNNNDSRRITNVTNSGNNYTITFDGEPKNLKKKTKKVLNLKPAVAASSYQLYVDPQEYPQLWDYLNVSDGPDAAYFTINGGEQIPVYYFWPRGGLSSGNNGITYHNYFAIGTETSMEYNPQDSIELHYTEKGTFIRTDTWFENGATFHNESPYSSANHAYRWFSWEEDLPHVKNARGNGVQGGWLDYHVQATWPDMSSRNWDNRTFSVFFDPKGYDNNTGEVTGLNNFRYQGFPTNSGPAQPRNTPGGYNYGGGAFGGGNWNNLQFQTLWDMYEDGIFFHAYHNNYDDNNQHEVKIDILWNARIFYADTPMTEPNDR